MKLSDFKALTFDCYGTLIDWETGLLEALSPLVGRVKRPLTKDQVLEAHARHEHAQEEWTPTRRYSELLATVYSGSPRNGRLLRHGTKPWPMGNRSAPGRPFPIPLTLSPISSSTTAWSCSSTLIMPTLPRAIPG